MTMSRQEWSLSRLFAEKVCLLQSIMLSCMFKLLSISFSADLKFRILGLYNQYDVQDKGGLSMSLV
jgi:hypothetical protein